MNIKNILSILLLLVTCTTAAAQDIVELTSKDGKSIHASLELYMPEKGEISLRLDGRGSIIIVSDSILDEASLEKVKTWHKHQQIVNHLDIKMTREPSKKGFALYAITLRNDTLEDINNIRLEYVIPYKEDTLYDDAKPDDKNPDYKTKYTNQILEGNLAVGTVKAQQSVIVRTDELNAVRIETRTVKKKTLEFRLINVIRGMVIKVYHDDTLITEVESSRGMIDAVREAKYD